MKKSHVLLPIFLLAIGSTALAQTPAFTTATPNSGPTTGQTVVTLRGVNLLPQCNILCPPLTLHFGDKSAAFTVVDSTTIRAVSPPHESGPVDIIYYNGTRLITLSPGFTFVLADSADAFETVLIPQAFSLTPGRFGSLWKSDFFLLNQSDRPLKLKGPDADIQPLGDECTNECFFPDVVLPRSIFDLPLNRTPPGAPPGVLLNVRKSVSSDIHYSLRIRDLSRQAQSAGTEIPVVREHEFRVGGLQLLNVPTNDLFRQTLRVYSPDSEIGALVLIRIYPMFSDVPIAQGEISLSRSTSESCNSTRPCYPAYGGVSFLTESFPAIKAVPTVRIELQSVFPKLRFWAMVSITNNDTQQVTTSTPQ